MVSVRQTRRSTPQTLPRRRRLLVQSFALALVATTGGASVTVASADAREAGSQASVSSTPAVSDGLPTPSPQPRPAASPDAARGTITAAAGYVVHDVTQVPPSALAAYQRTEAVMAEAMPTCHLDWTVLAAVGQVLTDHGRRAGTSRIDDEGRVEPAVLGPAIRDDRGRRLPDSDGGELDGSRDHDRALGPMLLAPATWRDIGVDGDADGTRDPQDIDDAALAAAVLLCADGENLQRPRQLARALAGMNDAEEFVTAVPEIAAAYATDFARSPATGTAPTTVSVGAVTPSPPAELSARTPASGDRPKAGKNDGKSPAGDDSRTDSLKSPDPDKDSDKGQSKGKSKGEKSPEAPEEPTEPTDVPSPAEPEPTEPEPEPEPTEPVPSECEVDEETTTGPEDEDVTEADEDVTPPATDETAAASDEPAVEGDESSEVCPPEDAEPVEETDSTEPDAPCPVPSDTPVDDDPDDAEDDDLSPCPGAPLPSQQQ